jgi:membrane protein implicated in regulation of membrane protease activity
MLILAHAKPEFAIIVAIIGVLLAVGYPAFYNGRWVTGGICFLLVAVIAGWVTVAYLRQRRGE